ncbi:MAG: tetratricopeptide repeat protein [Chloroflexi bacterium]|nr:tetratricopeptide repeat protein [Chloroflexota bacterium]
MIVRRDYRYAFRQRRRAQRVRWLLLFTTVVVLGMVAVTVNLDTVRTMAAGALGIKASPTLYPAEYAVLGSEAYQRGNMEDAAAQFVRAVQMQPNNVAYLYEYGKTLIEMNQTTEASTIADRAIAADPNDVRGYALKANALAYSDPTNAIIFALQGQELDPNFAPLYAALSVANTYIFRFSQALAAGERAIELDPSDANSYRAYSTPLIFVGRSEEAIEALETATQINPNLPGAWFELAFEYKNRANNPRRAIAIYQFMVENLEMSAADTAKAYLRICEAYAGADPADFVAAQQNCDRALSIDPNYGSAYRELGRMQYNRRNYEGAIETFETCVALGATDIECWALRGLAHYWMGQCDDAWRVLNEAQQLAGGREDGLIVQVRVGLDNVIDNCPDYRGQAVPTAVPPTAIPPTPIGGL